MPKQLSFSLVNSPGIVQDVPATELPAEEFNFAWSDGENVRFFNDKAQKFLGETLNTSTSAQPVFLAPGASNLGDIYVMWSGAVRRVGFAGTANVIDGISSFNMGGGYDGSYGVLSERTFVKGERLNSLAFVLFAQTSAENLQYNTAQAWLSVGNSTRAYMPFVLRSFGNFLVAIGYRENGTVFDEGIWWSTDADAGAVPATWDPADTTQNAGQRQLTGGGDLVDGLELRDDFFIYGNYKTWGMRLIGGSQIFRTWEAFDWGITNTNAVCDIHGHEHVCFTFDDIYRHDGVRYASILNKRMRRHIFDNASWRTGNPAFLAHNRRYKEIWIGVNLDANTNQLGEILTYNYEDETFGQRDVQSSTSYFDVLPHDFGSGVTTNNRGQYWPLICAAAGSTGVFRADDTFQLGGTNMTAFLERRGLHFGTRNVKHVTRVWPRIEGTQEVNIRVGAHNTPSGAITWDTTKAFTPDTDDVVNFNVKGRYIAIRVESLTAVEWDLVGMTLEIDEGAI